MEGSGGPIFNKNYKNGTGYKLRTHILIDIPPVDQHVHFTRKRKVLIFMIVRLGDMLDLYFRFLKPPRRKPIQQQRFNNYSSENQKILGFLVSKILGFLVSKILGFLFPRLQRFTEFPFRIV